MLFLDSKLFIFNLKLMTLAIENNLLSEFTRQNEHQLNLFPFTFHKTKSTVKLWGQSSKKPNLINHV